LLFIFNRIYQLLINEYDDDDEEAQLFQKDRAMLRVIEYFAK